MGGNSSKSKTATTIDTSKYPYANLGHAYWGLAMVGDRYCPREEIKVQSVWKEGPAWKAGIRPGHVIVSINGSAMDDTLMVQSQVLKSKIGIPVSIAMKKTSNATMGTPAPKSAPMV